MIDYITINMFERMWSDIPGKILLIILLISLLSLVAMIICGIFSIVNGAFLTYQDGQAKVVGKTFVPAHNTIVMQTTTVGNVTTMVPINIHHPDSYFITLTTKGMEGIFYISQGDYEKITKGMMLNVKYSKKRITNSLKFKEVDF